MQPADFKNEFDAERKRINTWVEGKTKDRIKNLIPNGLLNPLTRMVLVNAIYFKGEWKSPFKESRTKEREMNYQWCLLLPWSTMDFTGIHKTDSLVERLFISHVIHKTFLEVNEKGTEAAAATAVIMRAGCAMREPKMIPFTPAFNADRPFLVLIRHKPSGVILFMGRIMKP